MHINIGDICILDPTNEIYKQNEINSVLYVVVLNKRGILFPKYDCLPCTYEGEPLSNRVITVRKKTIIRVNPVVPAVVIRYPSDMPIFSDSDVACIDQLTGFFNNLKGQNGVEVDSIIRVLESLKVKLKFYYEIGYNDKEKVDNHV